MAGSPDDPRAWRPTEADLLSLEPFMVAEEESSCILRCLTMFLGVGNLRPLKLHFKVDAAGDAVVVERCGPPPVPSLCLQTVVRGCVCVTDRSAWVGVWAAPSP